MSKLRIAFVIPTMDQGGAEKQLALLAIGLPKDQFDVHVFLLTRDGPRSEMLRSNDVPVTVIGKRFKLDPSALFRLKRCLQSFQPDIVHTWLFAANSFGRTAAWLSKTPTIIGSERCVDPWKRWYQFAIDRWLAKRSQAITTNSQGIVEFYAQHGMDRDLFRVIPNGIASRQSEPIDRQQACQRLGIAEDRRIVLAVGRLWPQKRYRDLVWAAEMISAVDPLLTLVIIGDGPQKYELLRFRDDVTSRQAVTFVGHREDVEQLLPHAEVFWNGSEYEGQSNSIIEAMQAGVPVIASDIPGNRDLIKDQVTGKLVPLGDRAALAQAPLELLRPPDQAALLGKQASRFIEDHFTIEQLIQRHATLYQELCTDAGS